MIQESLDDDTNLKNLVISKSVKTIQKRNPEPTTSPKRFRSRILFPNKEAREIAMKMINTYLLVTMTN